MSKELNSLACPNCGSDDPGRACECGWCAHADIEAGLCRDCGEQFDDLGGEGGA